MKINIIIIPFKQIRQIKSVSSQPNISLVVVGVYGFFPPQVASQDSRKIAPMWLCPMDNYSTKENQHSDCSPF